MKTPIKDSSKPRHGSHFVTPYRMTETIEKQERSKNNLTKTMNNRKQEKKVKTTINETSNKVK